MRTLRHSLSQALFVAVIPALASSAALVGCSSASSSSAPSTPVDTGTAVGASVTRDLNPTVSSADSASIVASNTDFAFALYHGLSTGDGGSTTGNLFYSPYSVSLALAMTYAGAHGATATQMARALQFKLPPARLNPAFDLLDLAIQATPTHASGADGAPFAINVADSLWGGGEVSFKPSFVDTLAANYGAPLRTVDFGGDPAGAENDINAWVASKTDDKIDRLFAPKVIQSTTEFVIVNAVYFNAAWQSQFQKSFTETGSFTRADGTTVQTPLMSSGSTASAYAKGSNYQAVELPYSGGTTSMIIVLPDVGAYAAVEAGLNTKLLGETISSLGPSSEIDLTMPSFKIHGASVSLVPELEALGMTDAFGAGKADFTSMIPAGGVHISDVVHQAFVDVDESGTEAAAATGVVGVGLSAPVDPPIVMDVDRSFFFFIRDRASNTILFVGREDDPTAQ